MKYAAYKQYKPTDPSWLRHVPTHWRIQRLRFVARIQTGNTPSKSEDENYSDEGMMWVKPDDLSGFVSITSTSEYLSKVGAKLSRSVPAGSALVCCIGTVGKFGFSKQVVATNQQINALIFDERKLSQSFGRYVIAATENEHISRAHKNVVSILNATQQSNISIPLPPLDEQQTIARFLDTKTVQIDELIAKKRQLIAKLKEKRQALIARTVTHGLPPEAAKAAGLESHPEMKDSGVGWLGKIPEHWRLSPLKRIVCIPITDGPHETPEFPLDGVPFVSAEAVRDGRVLLSSMRGYISQEDHERYSKKYCPKKSDIFIVKSGSTTGKVAIVDFDDAFNVWSPLAAVRCDLEEALPEFVFFALSSEYFQGLVQVSWSFGTQPNIGMGVIGNLAVVLPPVSEQRQIADFLKIETARMNDLIERAESAIIRLTEYRQALITSAVTGKIDVRATA